jgi:hypothetical protein
MLQVGVVENEIFSFGMFSPREDRFGFAEVAAMADHLPMPIAELARALRGAIT